MNPVAWIRGHVRRHPHAADFAVAVVIFGATMLTSFGGPDSGRAHEAPVAVAFAAFACLVLVARRRRPLPVLLASTIGAEMYTALYSGQNGMLILLAPLLALYSVADLTERRRGLVAGAFAVLALAAAHGAIRTGWIGTENLALLALGGLAVAAGDSSRNRRAYLAEVERRAARAEHERDQDARRRVTEERLRIARDLHDSLGHHLALITVQAGVADRTLDASPSQAHEALTHVTTAGRSALGELRDTIGLLREPDDEVAPTQPTVGLDSLPDLVDSFRRSGLQVDEDVTGEVRQLAPAADLTAYRVIQESLTNVYKHAGNPLARLCLRYESATLHITVDDDGAGGPASSGGHGIVGMRERVFALGGELLAAPRPGGGFRVSARLPLEECTP